MREPACPGNPRWEAEMGREWVRPEKKVFLCHL